MFVRQLEHGPIVVGGRVGQGVAGPSRCQHPRRARLHDRGDHRG